MYPHLFLFRTVMNYQLSRRYFLRSSVAIALSQLLSGCGGEEAVSQVLFLENSIPPQSIRGFSKSLTKDRKIKFKPQTQIPQIFDSLVALKQLKKPESPAPTILDQIFNQIFPKSEIYPNLTSLGDVWLSTAIKQNLIQPLSGKSLLNWQKLPLSWQKLVQRNAQGYLADDGAIYAAPYRWGSTVIAYRSDKLAAQDITIKDWQDLWLPELRDRISLLDSPREVIGLTLKKLGQSYNLENLATVANLEAELLALHQQTKLYSSDHYLEPLVLGDTWAAVAWSTDVLPLLKRYPEIKFVIPQSGASLWADLWVKPQVPEALLAVNSNDQFKIVEEWINYCWQPQTAKQISLFTDGISPILTTLPSQEIPKDLQDNVFLNSAVLNSDQSEFLLPLKLETEQQYQDLWLKVRQSG
jgi:putative spermidine/putrescine transport system substrate-binding protein